MSTISEARSSLLAILSERYSAAQIATVEHALDVATSAHQGQLRGTGEPYVCHPIAVARLIADWKLDIATITAAILHDVPEDTAVTLEQLSEQFEPEIIGLVEGVTKLSTVRVPKDDTRYEVENLRRLFLAMAKDLRVVLLKLADRLHNVRTIKGVQAHKRQRIARETLEIFAPLADRLGMGEVRSELETLGFRYAEPEEYAWTVKQLAQTEVKRAHYIAIVKHEFTKALATEGIPAQINARTKNIYSLYLKLLQKERDIDKIYDLFAIRIIVDSVEHCYGGMGVIHRHWQPLPHRIKDYIAVPKLNGYRSLHTTIFGPENRLLEVQLRTTSMHEEAELGVAAHAVYAERKASVQAGTEQLAVMRQLGSWQDEIAESAESVDRFKLDLFGHRIFVFTPKGSLYSLPVASTPVDFAYAVHTEIGNTCSGAKVNGVIITLDTKLQNGDVVEILTQKSGHPRRDWLGFVRTGHARSAIRSYFRQRGELPPVRRQRREGIEGTDRVEAVGKSDSGATKVIPKHKRSRRPDPIIAPKALLLAGMSSLLTKRAGCCNPRPGDAIVGYITVGKGISVHRANCNHVGRHRDPQRLVAVNWGA